MQSMRLLTESFGAVLQNAIKMNLRKVEQVVNVSKQGVVLQIIYSFMLHFIYNHFQDYPKCHITLFKPDYAHKILLSKNEAHYLTRMRLLTARTFGFSVTYD